MTKLEEHRYELDCGENTDIVHVKPASQHAIEVVLGADQDSPDGRSNFVWVNLPNGDLILGVYPQGDTYFDVESESK